MQSLRKRRLAGGASRIRTLSTLWRIWSEYKSPDLADKKFELAVRISEVLPLARANQKRIRTAELGNREKRGLRRPLGPELAVSGSDTRGLDRQDPAESRGFPRLFLDAGAKSLQQQTEWRCRQCGANSSLARDP